MSDRDRILVCNSYGDVVKAKAKRVCCYFGIHAWRSSRPLNVYDAFPSPFDTSYQNPTRECARCKKKQQWLPGYGGSEFGCWLRCDSPEAT